MKKLTVFSLVISVVINFALLYRIFDLGVTTTYGSEEILQRNQQVRELEKLLPLLLITTSREQVLHAANQAGLEVTEKREEGTYIGMTLFSFSDNKVTAVTLR